jgi:glycosyltransferase involved in cell wall biosynthesis
MEVVLVCPQAHYPGHYWRDTHTLASALSAAGAQVETIVATAPTGGGTPSGTLCRSLPAWWRKLTAQHTPDGRRRKLTTVFANLETLACAVQALPAAFSSRGGVIHFLGGTHIFIFLLALVSSRPVFMSIYGEFLPMPAAGARPRLKDLFRDWLLNRLLRQRKLVIICETDSLRDRWRWRLGEHIHTIPYAISIPGFQESKAEARAALGLPPEATILLLFGTQREGKDYGVVLRAAKLLQPAVHLLFVGKSISQNNPQRVAQELGFTHATFVERFVDDAEVPRFFFASDAVVLPYAEGFDRGSGVILDACAYGRPIVASRTGYLRWFVEHHQAGFLYQPGNPEDLATTIRQFLALKKTAKAELESRVAATAKEHSWPEVVTLYFSLYRQYIASARS